MTYERVLDLFKEISRVPRGSGNPDSIAAFVKDFAEKAGCYAEVDDVKNVFVRKKAATGWEDRPTIIFQGHMDMVCAADEGVEHDFLKDPIEFIEDGTGWIYAPGTTLGADDGLGCAMMLGLIEDRSPSGQLEFIFTTDEETNMTGAQSFDCKKLTGKYLLNLDNEEEGVMIVSSAGISDLRMHIPYEKLKKGDPSIVIPLYKISVDGFQGGHSGIDINLPRLNAVQVITQIIEKLSTLEGFVLYSVTAGSHMNAIPKSASVLFAGVLPEDISSWLSDREAELKKIEPDARVHLTQDKKTGPLTPYTEEGVQTLIRLVRSLDHGVLAMDEAVEGLVQTSVNLARLVEAEDDFEIWSCFRSSVDDAMIQGRQKLEKIAADFGGHLESAFFETGWARNDHSRLVPYVVDCYREALGEAPKVEGIHAGLECGRWSRGIPDADLISMGPTLVHPHTTGERAELASLEKYVRLLNRIVEKANVLK